MKIKFLKIPKLKHGNNNIKKKLIYRHLLQSFYPKNI